MTSCGHGRYRIQLSPLLYPQVSCRGDYGNITEHGQQRSLFYKYGYHLLWSPIRSCPVLANPPGEAFSPAVDFY
ncbi:jg20664 [Pararge aegeria aegeria]|uniref:Jg20664 protein n=1 Tax=Pararge aegeria aegeria TaxID=348720 RepID=A0A8S4R4X2_9NEOP|nr:jg20664 [Pararge aegeria aegeria]